MALILSIETATAVCSVALHRDGQLLALRENQRQNSHSALITLFIAEAIKEVGLSLENIDAVCVSKGPGSYTGLRIGVSTAKGLCYTLDKPLLSINTLESMAHDERLSPLADENTLLCPMIDARRMEVYCALFNHNKEWVQQTAALIIDENSFATELEHHHILFFGDGAAKCRHFFAHKPNAVFLDDIFPSAKNMGAMAQAKFTAAQFEDLAYFEPYYLKEFVGTVSKKL